MCERVRLMRDEQKWDWRLNKSVSWQDEQKWVGDFSRKNVCGCNIPENTIISGYTGVFIYFKMCITNKIMF